MNKHILKDMIIIPVLKNADLYSESAVNLLLGTAAVESEMGLYLYQVGGPAIGLYQIEPKTHMSILNNYVAYRPALIEKLNQYKVSKNDAENLIGSVHYQTLIARFIYMTVKASLPHYDDVIGLANYWKDHYNTYLGKGTVEKFELKYKQFGIDKI
jgi:hypothetical protein